jgi:hypothetical protein
VHPPGLVQVRLPGGADAPAGELLLQRRDLIVEEAAEPLGVVADPVADADAALTRHRVHSSLVL